MKAMNDRTASCREKILVVDDNELILKCVSAKLERAGYQPFTALDGGEAVDLALRENLSLIVVDVNFAPDVDSQAWDGFQILERLSEVGLGRRVPMIAISNRLDEQNRERAQKCGVSAFFHKPLIHTDLIQVIRDTLETVLVA
jgi:CheY-like chemotaxis protein